MPAGNLLPPVEQQIIHRPTLLMGHLLQTPPLSLGHGQQTPATFPIPQGIVVIPLRWHGTVDRRRMKEPAGPTPFPPRLAAHEGDLPQAQVIAWETGTGLRQSLVAVGHQPLDHRYHPRLHGSKEGRSAPFPSRTMVIRLSG
jgi:hypothetical protein